MNEPALSRPSWAEVDLSALAHNLGLARGMAGRAGAGRPGLLAVVKADAYGHGAVEVSRALARRGVRHFGVATLEEGLALRRAGLEAAILLLGPLDPAWMGEALRHRVGLSVWDESSMDLADRAARRGRGRLAVHLKVDTGMSRLGFSPAGAEAVLARWAAGRWPHLDLASGYTHFACADEPRDRATPGQLEKFLGLPWPRGALLHAANSAGWTRYPGARLGLARVGILLYGALEESLHPLARRQRPVMALKTRVVALREIPRGQGVSYGHRFVARRPTRVATLALGYADGVPRALSGRGQVLVRGRRLPILGRVCMDLLMVDASALSRPRLGEEAVLLGRQAGGRITAGEWAELCGTNTYEVLCGISGRVPRRTLGG